MIPAMSDDPSPPDDVLAGLPRKRPQRASAKRDAARAKAAKAAAKPAAKPPRKTATNGTARPRPKAVKTPPREPAPTPPPAQAGRIDQSPAELAAAAVRATGELVELGGKVLKGVLGRLPRP
jgi:hypothetical protein